MGLGSLQNRSKTTISASGTYRNRFLYIFSCKMNLELFKTVKYELILWKLTFFRRFSCMFDCDLQRCVDVMLIFHFSDDSWLQFQTLRRGGHHFWLSRSLLTAIWNVASRWFWFCTFQMTFDCDLQHCVEVVLIFDFSDDFSKE